MGRLSLKYETSFTLGWQAHLDQIVAREISHHLPVINDKHVIVWHRKHQYQIIFFSEFWIKNTIGFHGNEYIPKHYIRKIFNTQNSQVEFSEIVKFQKKYLFLIIHEMLKIYFYLRKETHIWWKFYLWRDMKLYNSVRQRFEKLQ
jgi:hypothetical protein